MQPSMLTQDVVRLELSSGISGGNFVAASCDFTDMAVDATSMEASALLAGLQLAE
jgi:hypothetical protein